MKAETRHIPNSGRGVHLMIEGKHIKTIPKKYYPFWNQDFIIDITKKRLTEKELENLKTLEATAKKEARKNKVWDNYLQNLWLKDRVVHNYIKHHKITHVQQVKNFYEDTWFEAILDNNVRVKISQKIYDAFIDVKINKIRHIN